MRSDNGTNLPKRFILQRKAGFTLLAFLAVHLAWLPSASAKETLRTGIEGNVQTGLEEVLQSEGKTETEVDLPQIPAAPTAAGLEEMPLLEDFLRGLSPQEQTRLHSVVTESKLDANAKMDRLLETIRRFGKFAQLASNDQWNLEGEVLRKPEGAFRVIRNLVGGTPVQVTERIPVPAIERSKAKSLTGEDTRTFSAIEAASLTAADSRILAAIDRLKSRKPPIPITRAAIAKEAQVGVSTVTLRKKANPQVASAIEGAKGLQTGLEEPGEGDIRQARQELGWFAGRHRETLELLWSSRRPGEAIAPTDYFEELPVLMRQAGFREGRLWWIPKGPVVPEDLQERPRLKVFIQPEWQDAIRAQLRFSKNLWLEEVMDPQVKGALLIGNASFREKVEGQLQPLGQFFLQIGPKSAGQVNAELLAQLLVLRLLQAGRIFHLDLEDFIGEGFQVEEGTAIAA